MNEEKQTKKSYRILPLSLSIETIGGVATPIILRGTPLPTRRTQVFTTAKDNQEVVDIEISMGESPLFRNNREVGSFTLKGFPKAIKGEAEIAVTFEIDNDLVITANAVEKKSNTQVHISFETIQQDITDKEIEEILEKNNLSKEDDEKQLKQIETRNNAESLITRAEKSLQAEVDSQQKREIEKTVAELGLALDNNDFDAIRVSTEKLDKLVPIFDFSTNYGDIFNTFFGQSYSPQKEKINSDKRGKSKEASRNPKMTPEKEIPSFNIDEIGKVFGGSKLKKNPKLCFVLMPFNDEMKPIFDDHIKPTVELEGFSCVRADNIVGISSITRDIWEHIYCANFLIADLTGKNANVFYELGLAHAIGKDVILLTQTMEDVPFDLKGLRCIVYNYNPRGVIDLEDRLKDTIRKVNGITQLA